MKKYFNSLFPYRWILVLLLMGLSSLILIMAKHITKSNDFDIILICNIPFWFIVDYFLGIGQRNLWDRE